MLLQGDCREVLKTLKANMFDSIVTDPPYELGFMGKGWDATGIAYDVNLWRECLRVLKPGGHLLAFGGTRTSHRMVCAIEDAGFEIRDSLMWIYGSGFPKSLDVSKAIDKAAGADRKIVGVDESKLRPNRDKHLIRGLSGGGGKLKADNGATITAPATDAAKEWEGWGTALKPAHEPICMARKPLVGTVAQNVLEHGTGAVNIDRCRIDVDPRDVNIRDSSDHVRTTGSIWSNAKGAQKNLGDKGRWPANVILDEEAGAMLDAQSGTLTSGKMRAGTERASSECYSGGFPGVATLADTPGDSGGASRFFYCPKVGPKERGGSTHPTMKPVALMRWLVRLVTPKGGHVLDPFGGSGTTALACEAEGLLWTLIEREAEYVEIIRGRTSGVQPHLFSGVDP